MGITHYTGSDQIFLKDFAGQTNEDQNRQAAGLSWADLGRGQQGKRGKKGNGRQGKNKALTLKDFAASFKLPAEWLQSRGVYEIKQQGAAAVAFGYYDKDGKTELKKKIRFLDKEGNRAFFQLPAGARQDLAYMLKEALTARAAGATRLLIVEGETDQLCTFYGYDAGDLAVIGFPGSNFNGVINNADLRAFLQGFKEIVIWIDADQGAGRQFAQRIIYPLKQSDGRQPDIKVINPEQRQENEKDPAEIWKADPDKGRFTARLQELLSAAQEPDQGLLQQPPAQLDEKRADRETLQRIEGAENDRAAHKLVNYTGNRDRLVKLLIDRALYVVERGRWYSFDGRRFKVDPQASTPEKIALDELPGLVYADYRQIEDQAAQQQSKKAGFFEIEASTGEKVLFETRSASDKAGLVYSWYLKADQPSKRNAAINDARHATGIATSIDQLDADPYLLNTAGGVIDLRTAEIKPHAPDQRLTCICSSFAEFDPALIVDDDPGLKYMPADQQVLQWLTGAMPDPDIYNYVLAALGASIIGKVAAENLFYLFGPTQTGKTTFLEGIKNVLGDYATTATKDLLVYRAQVDNGPRSDIARLHDKRLITIEEADPRRELDTTTLKNLTGGGETTAAFKHENEFSFKFLANIWIGANDLYKLPQQAYRDQATWRRLKQIGFDNEPQKIDPTIKAALQGAGDPDKARRFQSSLLTLAVFYAKDFIAAGEVMPATPAAVEQLTADYRATADLIGDFIDERCEVDGAASIKRSELWQAFNEWQQRQQVDRRDLLGKKAFFDAIRNRESIEETKSSGDQFFKGIETKEKRERDQRQAGDGQPY